MTTYQVCLPYATFGIVCDDGGVCVEAAPIGKWMVGKKFTEIGWWVMRKNGTMSEVIK